MTACFPTAYASAPKTASTIAVYGARHEAWTCQGKNTGTVHLPDSMVSPASHNCADASSINGVPAGVLRYGSPSLLSRTGSGLRPPASLITKRSAERSETRRPARTSCSVNRASRICAARWRWKS